MKTIKIIIATTAVTGGLFIGGSAFGAFRFGGDIDQPTHVINAVIENVKDQNIGQITKNASPAIVVQKTLTLEERVASLEDRVSKLETNKN